MIASRQPPTAFPRLHRPVATAPARVLPRFLPAIRRQVKERISHRGVVLQPARIRRIGVEHLIAATQEDARARPVAAQIVVALPVAVEIIERPVVVINRARSGSSVTRSLGESSSRDESMGRPAMLIAGAGDARIRRS